MIGRIKIKDFLSIKESELDLSGHRLCVVDGFNKDEGGKSNGSGKTAFLEAIRWAILGDPGINRDTPIRHGAEAATVTLELHFRGEIYTLQRERRKRETFDFWIGDIHMTEGMTATEAQKKFERHFDIDPEVFLTLFVVDGNTIQAFCNYNSSERVAIVNKYFKNERWGVYLKRATARASDLENKLRFAEADRDSEHRSIISDPSSVKKEILDLKKILDQDYYPYRRELIEYEKAKASEASNLSAYSQWVKSLQLIKDNVASLGKELDDLNYQLQIEKINIGEPAAKQKEKERLQARITEEEDFANKLTQELQKIRVQGREWGVELGKLTEYVRILEDSKTNKKCEICDGKITSVAAKVKAKKSKLQEIKAKVESLALEANKIEDRILDSEEVVKDLKSSLRKVEEYLAQSKAHEKEIARMEDRIKVIQPLLAKAKQEKQQYEDHPLDDPSDQGIIKPPELHGKFYKLDNINESIEATVALIRQKEESLNRSEEAKKRKVKLDQEIKKLEAQRDIFLFWERAFGKYGIPIRVLDNFLPLVQERTNQYLSELNSIFRIALETKVPRKKDDGFKEKMEMLINNLITGSNFTLKSNSRGEVKAIATVLFLAFNSVVRDREGFDFNVLLLDEIFDGLDKVSRGMVFSLISQLTGFQILATSHYQDVNDKFHSKLLCTKDRGATVITEA